MLNAQLFFDRIYKSPQINGLLNGLKNNGKKFSVSGLSNAGQAIFLAGTNKKIVYVAKDIFSLDHMTSLFLSLGKRVSVIEGLIEYPVVSLFKNHSEAQFIKNLSEFVSGNSDVLIVLSKSLLQRVNKNIFAPLCFCVGREYPFKNLKQELNNLGYHQTKEVVQVGDYAVNGDQITINDIDGKIRLEFFDESLEKIKILDGETLQVNELKDDYKFYPVNIFNCKDNAQNVLKKLENSINHTSKSGEKAEKLTSTLEHFEISLSSGGGDDSAFLLPFLDGYDGGLLEACGNDVIVVFEEILQLKASSKSFYDGYKNSFSSLELSGELLKEHSDYLLEEEVAYKTLPQQNVISFSSLETTEEFDEKVEFVSLQPSKYTISFSELPKDLIAYASSGASVIVFCKDNELKARINEYLIKNNVFAKIEYNNSEGGIFLIDEYFPDSLIIANTQTFIIGTDNLIKRKSSATDKNSKIRKVFYLPKVGDYVVHETHGIGKCVALENLKLTSVAKDYFVIEYAGGDKLYLPSEQADLISAYVGDKTENIKLSKLGGTDFAKAKERVYKNLKEIAGDLVKLYAQRQSKKGFIYSQDNYLQNAFEDAFEYEETIDQLTAIEQIKADMQSAKLMDRLVCGDVGFGKTEVALRAAYKAILDGKQVAFLCPSTVLSMQHFQTCKKRFNDFGVSCELINRFKTPQEQKNIIERLKAGKIDIIVGTHRLLSADIEFKNLGLLILDEEQRFGVVDKEKIKKYKNDIDVLTLSATPIPRTLHMSLTGIRDISIIETPPKERLAIKTTVCEYSPMLLTRVLREEIDRGGQALVVFNNVEKISAFAHQIQQMLPDAKVGFAHGQMPSKMLENATERLYKKEYNIFVSTTLIENGVDLPSANSLVVVDSDKLGLGQLYQLRGRIGRSDKLAYAYFTYNPDKVLTADAYKRLEAICEFSELGAGFKIAMKDLEIRGAGNIFGSAQHGEVEKVGYSLYCKLLEKAIKEAEGEKYIPQNDEVKMLVDLPAFIDKFYITDEDVRIRLYTEISGIYNEEIYKILLKKTIEDYGEANSELYNLFKIAFLKNLCKKMRAIKVVINKNICQIIFENKTDLTNENIIDAVAKNSGYVGLVFDKVFAINFSLPQKSCQEKLDAILKFAISVNN